MKLKKHLFLLPVILCASCSKTSYKPHDLEPGVVYDNVYLIMGQSNASGCSPWTYLSSYDLQVYQKYLIGNEKVQIMYDCYSRSDANLNTVKFGYTDAGESCFGPEIGISEVLSQQDELSFIVKTTLGGSCLRTQYVDAEGGKHELYNRFVPFIKKQVQKLKDNGRNPRIRGVFWMQGESDCFCDQPEKYRIAEQHFFEYLRHDLNDFIYDHFNFVDAYISTKSVWLNPSVINNAKQEFCDANEHCYCIKTNGEDETAIDLNLKSMTGEGDDAAHYDSRSMLLLGKTAASYLIK